MQHLLLSYVYALAKSSGGVVNRLISNWKELLLAALEESGDNTLQLPLMLLNDVAYAEYELCELLGSDVLAKLIGLLSSCCGLISGLLLTTYTHVLAHTWQIFYKKYY